MSEEPTTVPVTAEAPHPVNQVTTVSKYLALALFVLLPFLGGYVGYHLAPVQTVEVERVVYRTVVEETSVWEMPDTEETARIKDQFQAFSDIDGLDIALLYREIDGPLAYYTTFIPNSSGCCGVVAYDTEQEVFSTTTFSIDMFASEKTSEDGRYIGRVTAATSTDTSLYIIDLEIPAVVKTVTPRSGETFRSGQCGYDGATFDLSFVGTSTFKYGVYSENTIDEDGCQNQLLEYREEVL